MGFKGYTKVLIYIKYKKSHLKVYLYNLWYSFKCTYLVVLFIRVTPYINLIITSYLKNIIKKWFLYGVTLINNTTKYVHLNEYI